MRLENELHAVILWQRLSNGIAIAELNLGIKKQRPMCWWWRCVEITSTVWRMHTIPACVICLFAFTFPWESNWLLNEACTYVQIKGWAGSHLIHTTAPFCCVAAKSVDHYYADVVVVAAVASLLVRVISFSRNGKRNMHCCDWQQQQPA